MKLLCLFAIVVKSRTGGKHTAGNEGGRLYRFELPGLGIESSSYVKRSNLREWKVLQTSSGVLVEVLESVCSLPRSMLIDSAAFIVKGLLHPEAGRGTVEQAEQCEMVIFGGLGRQLDDRS